jgi:hypothetical protein
MEVTKMERNERELCVALVSLRLEVLRGFPLPTKTWWSLDYHVGGIWYDCLFASGWIRVFRTGVFPCNNAMGKTTRSLDPAGYSKALVDAMGVAVERFHLATHEELRGLRGLDIVLKELYRRATAARRLPRKDVLGEVPR